MGKRPEGAVVILSEADAELLIQRLQELAESICDLLAARTMLLREPSRTRHARVIPYSALFCLDDGVHRRSRCRSWRSSSTIRFY
jgi:hypothetical protein